MAVTSGQSAVCTQQTEDFALIQLPYMCMLVIPGAEFEMLLGALCVARGQEFAHIRGKRGRGVGITPTMMIITCFPPCLLSHQYWCWRMFQELYIAGQSQCDFAHCGQQQTTE
ncbi:hypothetical protein ABBQ32_011135 [Trebouxia sp. C0010 RCD-2024]